MPIPGDLTASNIQAWANQLPYANKPLVAKETFEIIRRLPEYELPPRHQIAILEALEYPVSMVLEHLRSKLSSGHSRTEQFLSLGEAYCENLVAICEQLAANCCKPGGLRISDRLPRRGLALANHYFEQWNLLRASDHRPAPDELWSRVKQINAHAGIKDSGSMTRLVAFHLASPHRMTGRQIDSVAALLDSLPMEKLVRIGKPLRHRGETTYFLPEGDCPPEFGPVPAGGIPLDLTALVTHLQLAPPTNISATLLRSLLERWGGTLRDKQQRTPTTRPIRTTAVIGLGCIARHLNQTDSVFGAEFDDNNQYQSAFATQNNAFSSRSDSTEVSFLDLSDGGCRLKTAWKGIQNGDLIAVHWGRVEWRVGTIVWMVRDGDQSECGVQWLLKKPKPVSVRFDTGEPVQGISGNCLLDGQPALLYGVRHGVKAISCLVKNHGEWKPYHLSVSKNTGLVELARAEQAEDIPALNPIDQMAAPEISREDDMWNSLSPFSAVSAQS